MFKHCADLAQKKHMPVILRLTTHVCHAKEMVNYAALSDIKANYELFFTSENGPYIPITKSVFPLKKRALQNLLEIKTSKNEFNVQYFDHKNREKVS